MSNLTDPHPHRFPAIRRPDFLAVEYWGGSLPAGAEARVVEFGDDRSFPSVMDSFLDAIKAVEGKTKLEELTDHERSAILLLAGVPYSIQTGPEGTMMRFAPAGIERQGDRWLVGCRNPKHPHDFPGTPVAHGKRDSA